MPCNPSERVSQGSKGLLIVSYSHKVFWHVLTLQTQPLSIEDNWGAGGPGWSMILIFWHCWFLEEAASDTWSFSGVRVMKSWISSNWYSKVGVTTHHGLWAHLETKYKMAGVCVTSLIKQVRYKNSFVTFLGTLFTTCLRHIIHVAQRTQEGQSGKENKNKSTTSCQLAFI